jgi:TonB family protein
MVASLIACGARAEPTAADPPAPADRARPDLPLEHVITNPDWLRKPTADEVSRYFPYFARIFHISGSATISCRVTKAGELAGCGVVGESPAGAGFGEAALEISSSLRMTPRMIDGEPDDGGQVTIPLHFQAPDQDEPGPSEPPPAAAASAVPSPEALALGRRLAAATLREPEIAARITAYVQRLRESRPPGGQSPEQMQALDAFEQNREATRRVRLEVIAKVFAGAMPEPMLAQALAFMQSPAGARWASALSQAQSDEIAAQDASAVKGEIADLARLCQQIVCPSVDAPAASAPARP